MGAEDALPPGTLPSIGFPLPVYPDRVTEDSTRHSDDSLVASLLPDTDLCHYYLEHILLGSETDSKSCVHLTMDSLVQEDHLLLHSRLAVSAARIAWDMISRKAPPRTNEVHIVLLRGYQHYNMASKIMRLKLSASGIADADQVMTSTLMVLPFAAASQQISHWLSTQNLDRRSHIPLSSTPRDVITFVRGARTMMETLLPIPSIAGTNTTTDINQDSVAATDPHLNTPERPYKEKVRLMVVFGSHDALSQVQRRLHALYYGAGDPIDHNALACKAALGVLVALRTSAIAVLTSFHSAELHTKGESLTHTTSWLRSFVYWPCSIGAKPLLPSEPLTRLLLSFYAQVPQAYLDLVLPLLDQRLERPVGASSDWFALGLTQTQALALDIYAHWSVLMFLVAEESWWIGMLPEVTLTGLVNRYGSDFVRRLWPEIGNRTEWWPAVMLRKLRYDRAV